MKKLWNLWKELVDFHNSTIDYVNYDDAWSYDMVFFPLMLSIITGALFGLATLSIKAGLIIIALGFTGLFSFLILIPAIFEYRKMKRA